MGFVYAMEGLDSGGWGSGRRASGSRGARWSCRCSIAPSASSSRSRSADFQAVQFKLADMATRTEAARALTHRAAARKDAGEDISLYASMAKLFASETAMWVTTQAIQLFGGYGYMRDFPVEKLFRDAKVTRSMKARVKSRESFISRSLNKA